ncbi:MULTISPECIES: winged helix-turn-helix domain-containing protein [Halobacterium]|uniref:winged helix-turn-helix domain-containing protein n=1 Tax=Halobacterium TaxID=2239 RepID=UPI00073F6114|nr:MULTISPECIES: winged helix-turn-helix domain-containing protein [Halobacterium]MCG1003325.1 winged helix-turn-helix domain-containing protein [Halobacterium noricense]
MSEDTSDETAGEDQSPRDRLGEEKERAVAGFDQGVVDILSWVLDTETRARIFVYLRQHPWSTSEEVADGTGLYPSTVREALAELAEEDVVERRKRQSEGAGNNPYEYTAIAPSDLVGGVVGRVQDELNTVFNLDAHLGSNDADTADEPVRIEVEDGFEVEAEVGDTEAGVDVDVEAEAEGGDGDGGIDVDVEAEGEVDDTEAGVEGEAEVGDVDDEDEDEQRS